MTSTHNPQGISYVKENFERVELTKSYRSTRQIVEFTKGIIEEGETIEAFNRDGQKPTFTKVEDLDTLQSRITQKIRQLQSANYETIAVICKTGKECKESYEQLSKQIDLKMIEQSTISYQKGILILPAYLAKGIEFDAVIIYDASNMKYGREFERKLFYTACTRAMHELHLFSLGEMSTFMNKIPENSYVITV